MFFVVEIHALVDNIRQTYETELNEYKHIIQLFDNTDPNEHMTEILRLRKKIDELTTVNKVYYFRKFNFLFLNQSLFFSHQHQQLQILHQLINNQKMSHLNLFDHKHLLHILHSLFCFFVIFVYLILILF